VKWDSNKTTEICELRKVPSFQQCPPNRGVQLCIMEFKPAGDPCACFVGNISWTTSGEDLLGYFSGAGHVVSAEVMTHADTGRSKGWAVVRFSNAREAAQAVGMFDQLDFHDRQLSVRPDRAGFESAGGTVVFVGNLPWSATEDTLGSLLASFGPSDAALKTTASGKSRGFALVRFPTAEAASAFVQATHHSEMDGRLLEVRDDKAPDERSRRAASAATGGRGRGGKKAAKAGGYGGSRAGGGGSGEKTTPGARGGSGGGAGDGSVDSSGGSGSGGGGASGSGGGSGGSGDTPSPTLFVSNLNWNSTDDDLFQHFVACGVPPLSAKVQKACPPVIGIRLQQPSHCPCPALYYTACCPTHPPCATLHRCK